MKINVNRTEPCKVTMEVEVPKEVILQRSQTTFDQIQKVAHLPGFRQGKVPQELVRTNFASVAKEEILQKLIPEAIEQGIKDNNLNPVGEAEVKDLQFDFDAPLLFKAILEVKPQIELKKYKGLKVEKEKVEITDEDIDNTLKTLQERSAQLVVSSHQTLQEGDYAVIDYEIFKDGQPVDKSQGKNQLILIDKESFLPGFNEQLLGVKKQETKDVKVTLPNDFQDKNLAGQEAIFKVEVKEIKEKKLPEINDDFAKEIQGLSSLEELNKKISENLKLQEEMRVKKEMENQLINQLVNSYDFSIPPTLLERQINYLIEQMKQFIHNQHSTPEKLGLNDEAMRQKVKDEAERQIKAYLLLETIARKENIRVTDEEINQEIEKSLRYSQKNGEALRGYFEKNRDYIASQLEEDKILKFLLDNAEVKEVRPKKKKEHQSQDPGNR